MLDGPHFSTAGWEKDSNGIHPVEMLFRIAKFKNKVEAKYDQCRKSVVSNSGDSSFRKIVTCTYGNLQSFGNGKLEKQAKLVAARNMIYKLKLIDIGIINETIAAGVKTDINPHKKPIVQQFKMFKSAGTLASSFVSASSETKDSVEVIPGSSNKSQSQELDEEVKLYKAYLECKVEIESTKKECKIAPTEVSKTDSGIRIKRPYSSAHSKESSDYSEEPLEKKSNDNSNSNPNLHFSYEYWNPSNYGYQYGYNWNSPNTSNRGWGSQKRRGYYGSDNPFT